MKRILILAAALLAAGTACAQEAYREQRRSLFELLPIRSSDIVFLGNSLTDGCEWSELFDNRHIRNRGISSDRACELAERLDPIVEGHPKRLFLMIGINDLAGGAAPGEVIADIARVIDRLCEEKGVTYIDVWSALADGEGLLDKRYTNDGVHLVGEGYLVWRDVLKPYVK